MSTKKYFRHPLCEYLIFTIIFASLNRIENYDKKIITQFTFGFTT